MIQINDLEESNKTCQKQDIQFIKMYKLATCAVSATSYINGKETDTGIQAAELTC